PLPRLPSRVGDSPGGAVRTVSHLNSGSPLISSNRSFPYPIPAAQRGAVDDVARLASATGLLVSALRLGAAQALSLPATSHGGTARIAPDAFHADGARGRGCPGRESERKHELWDLPRTGQRPVAGT